MKNNLANCPVCGELFVKALRPICNKCFRKREENYEKVSTFLRKKSNRMATVTEVYEKTGVSIQDIEQFIREGRIQLKQFPNLGYPCESCGATIREGRLCHGCADNLKAGLDAGEKEKQFQQRKQANEKAKEKNLTYHSLQDRLKRD
ncbi:hypothetical protein P4637_02260 [Halalkalibacterium halodurans]|uniref:Flagellar protein n=2 Tax=Halalkalibacterium halodurans TaxID=86665 RepID=Q9K6V1_HALH5|nr:TIGR03826 family flagellar region protein [Halalkalibacterium halodurans]MED4081935.1 hypothetical protein [Halalkalibacterium halodurans]MED4083684.1 hypothetical protein [Halalkalibacterium halodurans]MED4106414.1 hypothetical protein [Halalkalibacterium halodurans]MED4107825.1 hypothetical protein [Halalkalibacterium halodurans]MED4124264.1 hypothetical protein [Halalkalibacterium halodurans]